MKRLYEMMAAFWRKLWNWRRKKPVGEIGKKESLEDIRWKSQQLFKKMGREVSTSQGGPNMPRYQPCLRCDAPSKRRRKTMGGARYWCHRCQELFYVKAR